jgi:hypothetical protein
MTAKYVAKFLPDHPPTQKAPRHIAKTSNIEDIPVLRNCSDLEDMTITELFGLGDNLMR